MYVCKPEVPGGPATAAAGNGVSSWPKAGKGAGSECSMYGKDNNEGKISGSPYSPERLFSFLPPRRRSRASCAGDVNGNDCLGACCTHVECMCAPPS